MLLTNRMPIDTIRCCDCLDGMSSMPGECIDLTVTSPPYDDMRPYGGHIWNFEVFAKVAAQLFRVTTPGGVVVWVVQDGRKDGCLTGTSARQWLHFQQIGFNLDSMLILAARGWRAQSCRYANQFAFGFVLSKGVPRTFNPILDRTNTSAGQRLRNSRRNKSGKSVTTYNPAGERLGVEGYRTNVWSVSVGWGKTTQDWYAYDGHPALMSEELARDLIRSWSRPGDVVFDPMMGSATTCKMAILEDRHYLGFEIHEPYFRLAERRMRDAHDEYRHHLDTWLMSA